MTMIAPSLLAADFSRIGEEAVSYTHLRAHETRHDLVCRLLLEKKKKKNRHDIVCRLLCEKSR